jgi:hypothetical protein
VLVGTVVAAAVPVIIRDSRDVRLGDGETDALRDALDESDANALVELEPDELRVGLGDVLPLDEELCEGRPEPVLDPDEDDVIDLDAPGD